MIGLLSPKSFENSGIEHDILSLGLEEAAAAEAGNYIATILSPGLRWDFFLSRLPSGMAVSRRADAFGFYQTRRGSVGFVLLTSDKPIPSTMRELSMWHVWESTGVMTIGGFSLSVHLPP